MSCGSATRTSARVPRQRSSAPIHRGKAALNSDDRVPQAPLGLQLGSPPPPPQPQQQPNGQASKAPAEPSSPASMLRERDREELLEMDPVQKRRLQEANERFSSPETKRRFCERQGSRGGVPTPSCPLKPVARKPCHGRICNCQFDHNSMALDIGLGSPSISRNFKREFDRVDYQKERNVKKKQERAERRKDKAAEKQQQHDDEVSAAASALVPPQPPPRSPAAPRPGPTTPKPQPPATPSPPTSATVASYLLYLAGFA